MKLLSCLLIAGFSFFAWPNHAAQTAQARLYCLSLKFQHSTEEGGSYSLDLTTLSSGVNGELAPDFIALGWGYTNSTWIILTDELFGEQFPGGLGLDLPAGTDADGNHSPDFFEVSRAMSASTSGAYNIPGFASGTATAQWSRDAGSAAGLCVLTLKLNPFQSLIFRPTFELLEYTGSLTYTPGATNVLGSVNLTQTGTPANEFHGPVQFTKISTNRFNLLSLASGYWTNATGDSLSFSNHLYSRDLTLQTNYSGYFEFWDGDPNTFDFDYWWWRLVINDANDADHDGIPDFSDDPQSALPRRPSLSLLRTATNVLLTIRGDVGHVHQVQEVSGITNTNWTTNTSVTLTNDPQVVALPTPSTSPKFWRVRAL